ncbi:MAG: hypothetical protein M3Y22_02355 [Pseudomonadota bacterium]|nr:hypothetical protein [Pseudomonadota bacterium]
MEAPGHRSGLVIRRVRARRRADLRTLVARLAFGAFAGEVRLIAPGGSVFWTDLVRIDRWQTADLPEECTNGLWRGEERYVARRGAMMRAIDVAVTSAVRSGILLSHDAAGILALASTAAHRARLPPSQRA